MKKNVLYFLSVFVSLVLFNAVHVANAANAGHATSAAYNNNNEPSTANHEIKLAPSENLMDVYQQALLNDPAFKSANQQWLADRENIPIARANLLPSIGFRAEVARSYNESDFLTSVPGGEVPATTSFYNTESSYSLSLSQPIFNYAYWAALSGAKAGVRASEATYFFSAQDLMIRVSRAYFAVLQAKDVLYFTHAKKMAISEQLSQTKHKYEVGLIPITDVNDAQASYDSTVADEIVAQNDLADKIEQLREITGNYNRNLYQLVASLPLVRPDPENINLWVKIAERQNYQLEAACYISLAAKEKISQMNAGHFPILNANAGYSYDHQNNAAGEGFARSKRTYGGLTLDLPVYKGGSVIASTDQAAYSYQKALYDQEKTHRSVVSQTAQNYLGVISAINKTLADKQSIISKASKLRSTKLSYEAGMRTMAEVLQAESELYDAERAYAMDQYSYINQFLALKEFAGTLNFTDLQKINAWLKKFSSNDKLPSEVIAEQGGNINSEQNGSSDLDAVQAPQNKVRVHNKKINLPHNSHDRKVALASTHSR